MAEDDLEAYFEAYAAGFNAFDAEALVRFFDLPCLMIDPEGHVVTLSDESAVRANTEGLLAHHERQGVGTATARIRSEARPAERLAIVTVDWTVDHRDGTPLWRFANTYNLVDRGSGSRSDWRIVVSTTHAPVR